MVYFKKGVNPFFYFLGRIKLTIKFVPESFAPIINGSNQVTLKHVSALSKISTFQT